MTDGITISCPRCGAETTGKFCASCGAPMSVNDVANDALPSFGPPAAPTQRVPVVPPPATPPTAPAPGMPGPQANRPGAAPAATGGGMRAALLGAGLAVLALAVIGGAFLLGRGNGDERAAPTTSTTSTSSTTAPATTAPTTVPPAAPATAPPPPATVGDVRAQPPNLFCRDLNAKGFGYTAAVDYWRLNGQPSRLDADKDGIPCETVYAASDVIGYWGTLGRTVTIDESSAGGFTTGLLCRDLATSGASTYEALEYYVLQGYPARMDADGNGIPCESVYGDAAEIWYGYFSN